MIKIPHLGRSVYFVQAPVKFNAYRGLFIYFINIKSFQRPEVCAPL